MTYLWCESERILHKAGVRVVLNVVALNEVLQMVQWLVWSVHKLQDRHLKDVNLKHT